MAEILLTQGKVALVDDSDYDWLSQWNWCAVAHRRRDGSIWGWYAQRSAKGRDGRRSSVYMHRALLEHRGILRSGDRRQTDHRDHNGLNNQFDNLRPATVVENQHNRRKPAGSTSSYKGVSWIKSRGKWQAQISDAGRRRHLGRYDTELEAAQAYDVAALEMFGDRACLNL